MGAIISTPWMGSVLSSLLLQLPFCVYQYCFYFLIPFSLLKFLQASYPTCWNIEGGSIRVTVFLGVVLESDKLIHNTIYNSSCIWRGATGLCDVWLYTLLSSPRSASLQPCKASQGFCFLLLFFCLCMKTLTWDWMVQQNEIAFCSFLLFTLGYVVLVCLFYCYFFFFEGRGR